MKLLIGAVGSNQAGESREVISRRVMTAPVTAIVKAGDQAPDFSLRSLDGRQVSLADYRGKKVIVFMWASW